MAKELPIVPTAVAGSGVEVSAATSWREYRPEVREAAKVNRNVVYFCPDGAISIDVDLVSIDLHICKGCGICASESDGIVMVPEYTGVMGVFGVKEVKR